jgi:hypothetical protein
MVAAIAAAAGIAELVGTMRCRFAYEGLFVNNNQGGQLCTQAHVATLLMRD